MEIELSASEYILIFFGIGILFVLVIALAGVAISQNQALEETFGENQWENTIENSVSDHPWSQSVAGLSFFNLAVIFFAAIYMFVPLGLLFYRIYGTNDDGGETDG